MIILSLILLGILALSVAITKVEDKNGEKSKLLALIMLGVPFGTLLAQLF